MIKLLIFDYDGVLFDTKKIAFNLVKGAVERYCNFKIRNLKEFADLYKSNFYNAMRKKGASKKEMENIRDYAIKELKKKELHIHNGIKSIIKKLSQTHNLAIISSNYDTIMKKNLKKHGILEDFNFILGVEEGESKRKKIKSLLKKAKASKAEAVFITDTVGDIIEAKSEHIKTLAVTWGFHKVALLKKSHPDFIVKTPKQMLEVMV